MTKLLFLGLVWLLAVAAVAQTPKLAIIAADKAQEAAADVFTARLSKRSDVALLERGEINRILAEQKIAVSLGTDFIKLGQILAADGLLVFETEARENREVLVARLIAARPGVALVSETAPLPLTNTVEWCDVVLPHFVPLLPKLTVLAKDAVPLSVLNLRSALQTPEARALERELTLMLILRLSREKEVFVLERQRMREMLFEQELRPETGLAFWTGRYLLEGTIDKDGFDKDKVTISARLSSPQTQKPVGVELSGPRSNPAAVVESLVEKVLAALHRNANTESPWRPVEEATQFFEEAKWDLRWGLPAEGQQASESAWALGQRTREIALLRLDAYTRAFGPGPREAFRVPETYEEFNWDSLYRYPEASQLRPAVRALELFLENAPQFTTNSGTLDREWFELGWQLLFRAGSVLEDFYRLTKAREGNEQQLSEVRTLTRQLAALLALSDRSSDDAVQENGGETLRRIEWEDGGLWFDQPETALDLQRRVLEARFHPTDPPRVVGWSWQDKKRVAALRRKFVADLRASEDPGVRLEGLYLNLVQTPYDENGNLQTAERELLTAIWESRSRILTNGAAASILSRTQRILRRKYGIEGGPYRREPLVGFLWGLRKDYLAHVPVFDYEAFNHLFDWNIIPERYAYSAEEARELLPLFEEFRKRFDSDWFARSIAPQWLSGLSQIVSNSNLPSASSESQRPNSSGSRKGKAQVQREKFRAWDLNWSGVQPGSDFVLQGALLRFGKIWFQVDYSDPDKSVVPRLHGFVSFDPHTGRTQVVPMPEGLGEPEPHFTGSFRGDAFFEVTADSLFVSVRNNVQRYRFRDQRWEPIPVPMQDGAAITELAGRLYLATPDSVLRLDPETKALEVVVSSRRRPAVTPVDALDGQPFICRGAPDTLYLLVRNHLFAYPLAKGSFSELGLPISGKVHEIDPLRPTLCDGGTLFLQTAFGTQPSVIGLWKDTGTAEALLQGPPLPHPILPLARPSAAPQWDWPEPYPLEPAYLATEGKSLWVLVRRFYNLYGQTPTVSFTDNRNATLLHFQPGFRDAAVVPILFEKDGAPLEEAPSPHRRLFAGMRPQLSLWFATPDGLLAFSRTLAGYWLIPKSHLNGWPEDFQRNAGEQAKAKP